MQDPLNSDLSDLLKFKLVEFKDLIEERQRWKNIDAKGSYFETMWKPKCWPSKYRILRVRQCKPVQQKGPLQLDFFEPKDFCFDYRVIVTNKKEGAKAVIAFHHGRGSQEKLFGEGKQHAALDLVPTRRKISNHAFTLAGVMAHNLSRELQMNAAKPTRKTCSKRPARWAFISLETLRQRILHRAGSLIRPQGRLTLVINANPAVEKEMLHYIGAANALG